MGMWFHVVEKDERHDLALCKIENFSVKKARALKPTNHPIATLAISSETVQQGQLVVVSGFPLGSWNPAVQLGSIAATETVNPAPWMRVPAGQRELLQVSVGANKGNSGGPVISLRTGKVIGVIIQLVPAPVLSPGPVMAMQNSGIMLAVPASWIRDLLARHHVTSVEHKPKEKLGLRSDL